MEQYLILLTVVKPDVGIWQLRRYETECEQLRILLNQTLTEVLKLPIGTSAYESIKELKTLLYAKSNSKKRGVPEDLYEVFGRLYIPTRNSEDAVWTLLLHLAAVTKLLKRIRALM